MSNWLLESILGESPVASSTVAPCPIVDDPQPLIVSKRSAETNRLIDGLKRDAAIKAICGQEVAALVKEYSAVSPDTPATVSLPEPTKINPDSNCQCPCAMCRSGSGCYNCSANPKCDFHSLTILDGILPVDEKTASEFRQAAASRQRERTESVITRGRLRITKSANFERWEVLPTATA